MIPLPQTTPPNSPPVQAVWWKRWWRRLPPSRQDRFATLGPLLAVLLFLSAIVVAITYLRYEELEREQEAVTRDVEYAQQRLRLRLLERQEQLMRLAREVGNKEIENEEFEKMLAGQQTAQQALDNAVKRGNAAIKQAIGQ